MIQFQCPHCQATIRIQDSAMGKQGTCIKCKQTIVVPTLELPAQQSQQSSEAQGAPQSNNSSNPSHPNESEISSQHPDADTEILIEAVPVEVNQEEAVNDLFSAISSDTKSSENDPIILATSQAQRSNKVAIITGFFFLLIGIGSAAAIYYFTRPVMQDHFTAQLMPANSIKPTLLRRKIINQPDLFEAFWLQHQGEKVEINSRLLETSVLAQDRGLEFRLYPGSDNDLYRVDVLKNVALHEFYSKNYLKIEGVRKNILTEAANDFLTEMVRKDKGLAQNPKLLILVRDRLILTAMVDGIGIRLAAIVEGKQYPCVWQDKDNRLFFSLPKGTIKFEIREAELADKQKIFPNSLRFTVTCKEAEKRDPNNFEPGHLLPKEKEPEEKKSNDAENMKKKRQRRKKAQAKRKTTRRSAKVTSKRLLLSKQSTLFHQLKSWTK